MKKILRDFVHDLQYVVLVLNILAVLAGLFILIGGVITFGIVGNGRAIWLLSLLIEFFTMNAWNSWKALNRIEKA